MAKIKQNFKTNMSKWIIAICCIAIAMFTLFGGATLQAMGADNPVGEALQNLLGTPQGDEGGDAGNTAGDLGDSGDNVDPNAQNYTLTIEFYNNKMLPERYGKIAEDVVKTFEERTSFEFTVDLPKSNEFGEITYYSVFDGEGSPLECDVDNDNHTMTVTSEVGLYQNMEVEVTCGSTEYVYEVHYFFEDTAGTRQEGYKVLKNCAPVGTAIPTVEDITRASEVEGVDIDAFSYDGKASSSVIASFDNPSTASVYFRRNLISVSFNPNEGYGGPGNFFQRAGSTIAKPTEAQTPTRTGYTFKGWFTEAEGGEEIVIPDTGFVVPNDDIVLYAHWEMNSGQKRMQVVYWGQNGDIVSSEDDTSANPEDYTYLTECSIFGDYNTTYEITETSHSDMVMPHYTDSTGTNVELTELDLDGDGIPDADTTDCYYVALTSSTPDAQKPICDDAKTFDADNLTIYNVYLKRVTYTWDFYKSTKSYTKIGTITARWGQYIYPEYKAICQAAWDDTSISTCPWYVKIENGYSTWQNLFTHMTRENRTGRWKDDGSGGYARKTEDFPPSNPIKIKYYLQDIDKDDDHPNIQSTDGSNDNFYKITELSVENSTDTYFTTEELLTIEGFVAPSNTTEQPGSEVPYYSDDADCPYIVDGSGNSQDIGYTETEDYSGWNIYYTRAKHYVCLCAIMPHTEVTTNEFWEMIYNVDYYKTLGDIEVPEECLGVFVDDEGQPVSDRQLRHYVPVNPHTGSIDPNFVFDGWTLSNNLEGETIDLENTITQNNDLNLFAKWKAPEISVKFNQVTGPKTEEIASSKTLTGTYNTMLQGDIPTPTAYPNYYFVNWYYYTTDAQGNQTKVYFDPSIMPLPAYDIELFPEYSQEVMETEYAIRPQNTPLIDHGTITPSTDVFTLKGKELRVSTNTLTVENSAGEDVVFTATPTSDSSGVYEFVKWQVRQESYEARDIVEGETVQSDLYLTAIFKLKEGQQRATINPHPTVKDDLVYNAQAQDLLKSMGEAQNGVIKYAVGSYDQVPEKSAFSTSMPQATYPSHLNVYYYAEATTEGYIDSEVYMTDPITISRRPIPVTVTMKNLTRDYNGSTYTFIDRECYELTSEDPLFDIDKAYTYSLISLQGTDPGTYNSICMNDARLWYHDEYSYLDFDYQTGEEVATLTINEPSLTNPTLAANFASDGTDHALITTAAVASFGTPQYALTNSTSTFPTSDAWTTDASTIVGNATGTYVVWVRSVDASGNVLVAQRVAGTVYVHSAPIAATGLTYNGNDQALIATAGVAPVGTIEYQATAHDVATEEDAWSSDIADVVKTNAGTYDIHYRIFTDDESYTVADTVACTATIGKYSVAAEIGGKVYKAEYTGSPITATATDLVKVTVDSTQTLFTEDMVVYPEAVQSMTRTDAGTYQTDDLSSLEWKTIQNSNFDCFFTFGSPGKGTFIIEAKASVVTAPTLVPDSTYTGSAQQLIATAGEAKNGTLMYGVSDSEDTEPTTWNATYTNITGTNAGTYYVWYKVNTVTPYVPITATLVGSVTIAKVDQEISVFPEQPSVVTGSTLIVSANGIAELTEANLTWTVTDGADKLSVKATYDNCAVIQGVAAGSATLTIKTDETTNYNESELDVDVTVSDLQEQDIIFWPTEHEVYTGEIGYAYAANLQENPVVTWKIQSQSSENVIELEDGSGARIVESNFNPVTYKGLKAGTATIKITTSATEHYLATERTITVTVKDKAQQTLTFNKDSYTVNNGNSMLASISGAQEEPRITWEIVDDTTVVKVEYEGEYALLTGLKAGNARVKVTTAETDNYAETVAYANVVVNDKLTQDITFDKQTYEVVAGSEINVIAGGFKENPDIKWTLISGSESGSLTYNENAATVKGIAAGEVTIAVTSSETENYGQSSEITTVTVKSKPSQSLAFDKSSYTVPVDETTPISITGAKEDPRITWEITEGSTYASVKYEGSEAEITGLAEGTATITATVCETETYAETKLTTTVTVNNKPKQTITIDPTSVSIKVGETATVQANGLKENPTLTWSVKTGSGEIFSIEGQAITNPVTVKGLSEGTGKIVVTVAATASYAQTTAEADVNVSESSVAYLANRSEAAKVSIFYDYIDATSATFTNTIPTEYVSCSNVDIENKGLIKAYKVADGDGYKLIVASQSDIAASATSCKTMFKNFKKLTSVDFGSLILDEAESMAGMFSGCSNIPRVELSSNATTGFNTSNVTSFDYMFDAHCAKLKTVVLGDGFVMNENATMCSMFYDCTALTNIVVPENTDWTGTKGLGTQMFYNCIGIPQFDSKYIDKSRAYSGTKSGVVGYFVNSEERETNYLANRDESTKVSIFNDYCDAVSVEFTDTIPTTYVSCSNVDIERKGLIKAYKVSVDNGYKLVVASSGNIATSSTSCVTMFKNFKKLTSVDFGSVIFDSSISMAGMFGYCTSLKEVYLCSNAKTGFNTSGVNNFSYMFDGHCTQLQTVQFGDGFVVQNNANVCSMFDGCTNLSIIIANEGTDWSTTAGSSDNMFRYCYALPGYSAEYTNKTRAYTGVKSGVTGYFKSQSSVHRFLANRDDSTRLSIIDKYNQATSVTFTNVIPTTYDDCINVDIENLGFIKAYKIIDTDGSYHVDVASQYTIASNEKSFMSIFKGFTKLKSVNFDNVIFDYAISVAGMFSGCKSIEEVDFSTAAKGFNTANVKNFSFMFDNGCTKLRKVTFPEEFVVAADANLTSMFYGCYNLSQIVVPSGTDWSSGTGASADMFYGCYSLPNFNASNTGRAYAFEGTKGTVKGYFTVSGEREVRYLLNRDESAAVKVGILDAYNQAKTVTFSHDIPSQYSESIVVDINKSGDIKAYKVPTNDGYNVVVASQYTIASSSTSCKTLFKNFINLTSVNFGDVKFDKAENMAGMFSGCKSIEEVDFSTATNGFNTRNVKNFSYMFDNGCIKLKKIILPAEFVVAADADLTSMFYGCYNLAQIIVPSGTDWSSGSGSSANMFFGCYQLPGFSGSYTTRNNAFIGEKGTTKGYFTASTSLNTTQNSSDSSSVDTNTVYYLANRNESTKTSIFSKFANAVSFEVTHTTPTSYIDSQAVDCNGNGDIVAYAVPVGNNYKLVLYSKGTIAANKTSCMTMFKKFTNLTNVNFGDINFDSAQSLAGMFSGCSSIEEIDFSTATNGFNTKNVKNFSYMFDAGCTKLKKITFTKEFVVSGDANLTSMFYGCYNLSQIVVPAGTNWSSGTGASANMFFGCYKLPNFSGSFTTRNNAFIGVNGTTNGYFTINNS